MATAPLANSTRAVAMSRWGVSTATPEARTSVDVRAAGQMQHQVEVVDHQVEHHGDVGPARLERRQAGALEVADVAEMIAGPRRMARLKRSMCPTWSCSPRAPRRPRSAHRPPRGSPRAASPSGPGLRPRARRSPTAACADVGTAMVTARTCAEQLVEVGEGAGADLGGHRRGPRLVDVVHADQLHPVERAPDAGRDAGRGRRRR